MTSRQVTVNDVRPDAAEGLSIFALVKCECVDILMAYIQIYVPDFLTSGSFLPYCGSSHSLLSPLDTQTSESLPGAAAGPYSHKHITLSNS